LGSKNRDSAYLGIQEYGTNIPRDPRMGIKHTSGSKNRDPTYLGDKNRDPTYLGDKNRDLTFLGIQE